MTEQTNYKCPCCGAPLRFDGGKQKLQCDSCGNDYDTEEMEQFTNDQADAEKESTFEWDDYNGEEANGTVVYTCPSCGGEIIGDKNTVASKCPYCDNPVVMNENISGVLKPDYILPFVLSKEEAKKALLGFYKGKKLLPDCFAEENHLEDIQGLYVPFWIFDSDVTGSVVYNCTRVHRWSDRNYDYTRTDYFRVYRQADVGFAGIPVDGSTRMDDGLMDSIEPFDYTKFEDFGTAFMPGFMADKYDVDAKASRPRMEERVTNSTMDMIASTVKGYATRVPVNKSITSRGSNTKYVMMPVWILNTKYKGEKYRFAVNGQTGKVSGNLPIDWGKYFRRLLIGAGIAMLPLAAFVLWIGGIIG